MEVYRASAWRQITSAEAFVGGSWRTLSYGESFIGGSWRQIVAFVSPMSLSVAPTTVSGSGRGFITTNAMTATPTGGLAPFTYSWAIPPGSGGATAASPTSASTTFGATLGAGGSITSYATCTVTDSLGNAVSTTGNFNITYV